MHVIQVSDRSHLVLDDLVNPRWLIVYGPMVHRATGETPIVYRVERWHLDPRKRTTIGVHEHLGSAKAWCAAALEVPDMNAPLLDDDGRVVTVEVQRQRWEAGLDLRTGLPRRPHTPAS